jgi:DNA-binding GntR family transcriptional regulator
LIEDSRIWYIIFMDSRRSPEMDDAYMSAGEPPRLVDRLRTDIVEGIWRQDGRLRTRDLAAHYGVSTAPIREALQQLQGEGLVVQEVNCGARVRPIDETLLINIFDVREALESFLTARFAAAASPHQIATLRAMQVEHDAATDSGDGVGAAAVNGRFHLFINGCARNPEATEVINRGLRLTRALRMECGFSPVRMEAARVEHHALIEAITSGDDTLAGRLAALHVRASRDDLVERLGPLLRRT